MNAFGLVLVLWAIAMVTPGGCPAGVSESDRVLIEQVRLLYPGASGFQCSEPIDLLLEGGRVAELGMDAPTRLEPGQMRLRGQNRWLLAAPRARLTKVPRASDIVVAGLSGLGALAVDTDQPTLEAVWARARLDTSALPARLTTEAAIDGVLPSAPGRAPTLARLAQEAGGPAALLDVLARRSGNPFAPGAAVAFLLLSEDPRSTPEAFLDPHAVLLGDEVLLKSERITRLEEAAQGERLSMVQAHERDRPAVEKGASWSRRYRLVVDGLERGWAILRVGENVDGSVDADITARVASPVDEALQASVSWSAPVAEHGRRLQLEASVSLKSQGRQMVARSIKVPSGRALEIHLDGAALEGGPIPLQPDELVLPHTLLILLDSALMAGTSPGGEVLELAFMSGPLELHRSPRVPLRRVQPGDAVPLDEAALRVLGGGEVDHVRVLGTDAEEPTVALVALDGRGRPLVLLVSTPWGYLEWSGGDLGGLEPEALPGVRK